MDTESHFNYGKQKLIQEDWRAWLPSLGFTLLGTYVFNQEYSLDLATKMLSEHHRRLDQRIGGKRYSNFPATKRTFFIGFFEKIHSNLHCHALIRPIMGNWHAYSQYASKVWYGVCKEGSYDIRRLRNHTDLENVSNYLTKELWKTQNLESYVISDQFLPKHIVRV